MKIKKVIEKVKKAIPSVDKILSEATSNLKIKKFKKDQILGKFEILTKSLEGEAFKIYRKYENKGFKDLANQFKEKGIIPKHNIYPLTEAVRRFEFIAGQMRKARGGVSFQKIIKILLNNAGIPCEEPSKETKKSLRRIDLVSPNSEVAKNTPDKAIFLAVKRTLRERWKQAVPEQIRGSRLYVVTLNGNCPGGKANEIKEAGMVAYVPDELKKKKELKDKPWIRSLTNLPKDIKSSIPKNINGRKKVKRKTK